MPEKLQDPSLVVPIQNAFDVVEVRKKRCCYCGRFLIPFDEYYFISVILGLLILSFLILGALAFFTLFNSSTISRDELKTPYQFDPTDDDRLCVVDAQDSNSGIFTFLHITDLHISRKIATDFEGALQFPENHSYNLDHALGPVADVLNPAYVFSTGDLVEAFNDGFSQGIADWDEYWRIIDAHGMGDLAKHMDIRGNHDVYGLATLISSENFYCNYSALGLSGAQTGAGAGCDVWRARFVDGAAAPTQISLLQEYRSRLATHDVHVRDSAGDEVVYRFNGFDVTPIPSTPFPCNYLTQMDIEFLGVFDKYFAKLPEVAGAPAPPAATIFGSHYFLSQVSVQVSEDDAGNILIAESINALNGTVHLSGHEHATTLMFNSERFPQYSGPCLSQEDYQVRLFAFDADAQSLAAVNIDISRPLNVPNALILSPPHSSFTISEVDALVAQEVSTMRVLVYSSEFNTTDATTLTAVADRIQVAASVYFDDELLGTLALVPRKVSSGGASVVERLEPPLQASSGDPQVIKDALAGPCAVLYTADWAATVASKVGESGLGIIELTVEDPDVADSHRVYVQPFTLDATRTGADWYEGVQETYGAERTLPLFTDKLNMDVDSWFQESIMPGRIEKTIFYTFVFTLSGALILLLVNRLVALFIGRSGTCSTKNLCNQKFSTFLLVFGISIAILSFVCVLTSQIHGFHEESAEIFVNFFGSNIFEAHTDEFSEDPEGHPPSSGTAMLRDPNIYFCAYFLGSMAFVISMGVSVSSILSSYFTMDGRTENPEEHIGRCCGSGEDRGCACCSCCSTKFATFSIMSTLLSFVPFIGAILISVRDWFGLDVDLSFWFIAFTVFATIVKGLVFSLWYINDITRETRKSRAFSAPHVIYLVLVVAEPITMYLFSTLFVSEKLNAQVMITEGIMTCIILDFLCIALFVILELAMIIWINV
eukprot:gnl/Chilomastix_cuspidata/1045.p1 GENE.gnl/Chilomastix_cuspidata/1045~~gnl/Chilomastix_cuspidata/1045.p1  ORF type:complete len:941 (+),score=400.25 gnl/Chilomastix_cuspidata/1045:2148-4970(+)